MWSHFLRHSVLLFVNKPNLTWNNCEKNKLVKQKLTKLLVSGAGMDLACRHVGHMPNI